MNAPKRCARILALVVALCATASAQLAPPDGGVLAPVGSGSNVSDYLVVGPEGVEIPIYGPGDLSGWVRAHYEPGAEAAVTMRLLLEGVPGIAVADTFTFKPSSKWRYGDDRPGTPSGGRKLTPRRLPEGAWTLRLVAPDGPLLAKLDWESEAPVRGMRPAVADAKPEKKKSPWKTGGSVGLETIYDDNFLRYSDDYLDLFHAGEAPYKFKIEQEDSHIYAPSVNLWARRRLIDAGDTKFDFRYKIWKYMQGDIKTNMSFDYGIRQYLKGGKSLEIGYAYAPEQYIRQLSDRPPGTPQSEDIVWEEFRYTRNVFDAIWRQKLHKKVNLKLWLTRSLRYYNRPFMENDIKDLGLRGTIYWRAHRDVRVTLDYGFTLAAARGADEVGETVENSDNSDPSYERDLYQVDVTWSPKWLKPVAKNVSLRGGYQVYWFTSTKALEDDPYHRGRIDRVYMAQLRLQRDLPGGIGGEIGIRYAQRTVESPWDGDIASDKDYDQRRYWIGLTYKL